MKKILKLGKQHVWEKRPVLKPDVKAICMAKWDVLQEDH